MKEYTKNNNVRSAEMAFQLSQSITTLDQLREKTYKWFGKIFTEEEFANLKDGLSLSKMSLRLTPYVLSLFDWNNFLNCPFRKMYLPLASEYEPPHPLSLEDSLNELFYSVDKAIIHRYPNRVLFLPLSICPVYCGYCTRSYRVGAPVTSSPDKKPYVIQESSWENLIQYLDKNPEVNDVLISGGDISLLPGKLLKIWGQKILDSKNVYKLRLGTKVFSVLPQKIQEDLDWLDMLESLQLKAVSLGKQFMIHTHFSHDHELTEQMQAAFVKIKDLGINVRNQTVLLRNVNDDLEQISSLFKKLTCLGVRPYYVHQHDLVKQNDYLRTSLAKSLELEQKLRGKLSGFEMPQFVVDLPGGGGKQLVNSFLRYNKDLGLSFFNAGNSRQDRQTYYYADPLFYLSEPHQTLWNTQNWAKKILEYEKHLFANNQSNLFFQVRS